MAKKAPDDFMVWGIAVLVGCIFLCALPKIVLVFAIAGLAMGYCTIGSSGKK
jgi:hypothetical protein